MSGISVGVRSDEEYSLSMYGNVHAATRNYLTQLKDRTIEGAKRYLETGGERARQLFDRINSLHDRYHSDEAIRRAKAVLRTNDRYYSRDIIKPLWSLDDLQQAKPKMQKIVMSNLRVRRRYLDQTLNGYAGSYHNSAGSRIGFEDPMYRQVVNGIVFDGKDEEGNDRFYADVCYGDIPLDDNEAMAFEPLTHQDQVDALDTWKIAEWFLDNGEDDFTDSDNGSL